MCRLVIKQCRSTVGGGTWLHTCTHERMSTPYFDPTSFMRWKFVLMSAHLGVNFAWLIKLTLRLNDALEICNGIIINFYQGLPCTYVSFFFTSTFLPHLDTQTLKVAVIVALVLLAVVLAIAVATALVCRQAQRYVCLMRQTQVSYCWYINKEFTNHQGRSILGWPGDGDCYFMYKMELFWSAFQSSNPIGQFIRVTIRAYAPLP